MRLNRRALPEPYADAINAAITVASTKGEILD